MSAKSGHSFKVQSKADWLTSTSAAISQPCARDSRSTLVHTLPMPPIPIWIALIPAPSPRHFFETILQSPQTPFHLLVRNDVRRDDLQNLAAIAGGEEDESHAECRNHDPPDEVRIVALHPKHQAAPARLLDHTWVRGGDASQPDQQTQPYFLAAPD